MGKSQKLYEKAKRLIPGGTQLLSKRPEMFLPGLWPAYYEEAKGCTVRDLDGKRYIDMSHMGVGSCILGYADKDVNKAVNATVDAGNMSTLNAPEEIELAEVLTKIHPWAKMARYARTGGESMAIAVRIARAYTGKDIVLFCGYHGWSDWYLSSNLSDDRSLDGHLLPGLEPKGVPRQLKGTAIPFNYNDTKGFLKLAGQYKGRIAAVVTEPIRNVYPKKGFLETLRSETRKQKIPLIIDEITAGWRLCCGGAHKLFGIEPDLAVFAKAMSNGFPMAAVIGRREVMDIAQETFISSTYWTDRIGPVSALATITKLRKCHVTEHLETVGKKIQEGWRRLASEHGIRIEISGIYPLGHFSFKHKEPLALKTLYTQLMLQKGFLATNAFYASYAHKGEHVDGYLQAAGEAFRAIAIAIESGKPAKYLKGPVCHSDFKRLA
ncbi:MAG: aminotransferase class III-fold pyridoxal phosphate-dependent enzyme [Candidatus Omnitrophica bacterium]|nr:aminotransferase class III-fold pyridoxal phosphate-dependent enzyme [Candidatus Omnitrophota bacterium]MBU1808945.1 aminotransferase class III-fold pyridoxal phosphate-dependent enzyme [Candidatus Omnitrophota bacterium]